MTQHAKEITLLGFAVDEGVRRNNGRVGARDGPRAIRDAMARIPNLQAHPVADGGDTVLTSEDLEQAQQQHAVRVANALHAHTLPVSVGGGHELAWATFQGITSSQPTLRRVLVINFDAHFDLRSARHSTSGTSFRQMHEWCVSHNVELAYRVIGLSEFANADDLFAYARAMKARWWTDIALQSHERVGAVGNALRDELLQHGGEHDAVYVSICLDVLPGADAPGVSAPAAMGIPLAVLEQLLAETLTASRLRAVDIAELNPLLDRDGQTARIAARLMAGIIRNLRGISPAP